MSLTAVIDALALPANALVNQRIPKKLLLEQGVPTAADKKQIREGIEDLEWVAALKPSNIGVPVYQDFERDYVEISVLTAVLRENAKATRLIELIHRTVPYPILLISACQPGFKDKITISAGHKRFALNDAGKFVVDEILATSLVPSETTFSRTELAFLDSLTTSRLPTRNLYLFYQGWIESIVGLESANITGTFRLPESSQQMQCMRKAIIIQSEILNELAKLRSLAIKEKQVNRLVELNTKIKRLEAILAANKYH